MVRFAHGSTSWRATCVRLKYSDPFPTVTRHLTVGEMVDPGCALFKGRPSWETNKIYSLSRTNLDHLSKPNSDYYRWSLSGLFISALKSLAASRGTALPAPWRSAMNAKRYVVLPKRYRLPPGLWSRSPSNFGWLEPKTFRWWSRSLKFGFRFHKYSLMGKRVVQIMQCFFYF